jgi:hypothetical protein
MKTLDEIFKRANYYDGYPDDFNFSDIKCPELEPFDKIIILTKSEVEFLKEENLWDENNPLDCGNFATGIVLPHPDSEERGFEYVNSVICTKTPCPKEGVFFDYISFADVVTYEDFHSIIKF